MTREQAYEKLELPVGTDLQVVRQKFQQMHNDFQVQIDGSFSVEMRQRKEQQLEELKEAYALLNESKGTDDSASLPWTEKNFDAELPSTYPLEQSNQQLDVEQSLALFGLHGNQAPHTIITRVQQHIEELQAQSQGVKIPEAKALYRKEISKAERAKEVIAAWLNTIAEKQHREEERLRREAEDRQRQEALRAKEENHRRLQAEEAQRQEAIRRQEEKKLQQEKEKLAAERKQWEAETKLREEQLRQAEQQKENPAVQTNTPSEPKKGNKTVLFLLGLMLIGSAAYFFLFQPNKDTDVDNNASRSNDAINAQTQTMQVNDTEATRDAENWKDATEINTIASYAKYLDMEPSGAFREQAQQAIAKVENEKIKKTAEDAASKQKVATSSSTTQRSKPIPDRSNTVTEKIPAATPSVSTSDSQDEAKKLAQYEADVKWARNMINSSGCDACRRNEICKRQVLARLNSALKINPNGIEAKELMQCLIN